MRRRGAFAVGLALGGWAVVGTAQAATSSACEAQWLDSQRQRTLPLRLDWPSGAVPADGWPMVVYSHGLGGSRNGGEVWVQAWVAAGVAVLRLEHPGSNTAAVMAAGGFGPAALARTATAAEALARVQDVQGVLAFIDAAGATHASAAPRCAEATSSTPPWPRLRTQRIGMAGHSFGAQTTLSVLGQAAPMPWPDLLRAQSALAPRLAAGLALSPMLPAQMPGSSSVNLATARSALGSVRTPVLLATGSADGDPLGRGMTSEHRAMVFEALCTAEQGAAGQKGLNNALLWLQDADHMSFAGVAQTPPMLLRTRSPAAQTLQARHHALITHVTALWWRAHLLGDGQALAALSAVGDRLAEHDRWRLRPTC